MKWFLAAFCLLAFAPAQSQNRLPEREAFTLKIQRNAQQFYVQDVPKSRYLIKDQTLQIYPQEKVNLEIEIKADTIYSMVSVVENLYPEKTVEIEFCQGLEKNMARPALLYVKNPFGKKMHFNILVYEINDREWQTVSKTANANWTSVETWKKIISSIVIKDWKFEENPKP